MQIGPTYPGVYIEEVSSGVRPIVGVPTSITAFLGRTLNGPANAPTLINSFGEFEQVFGALWADSQLGFAAQDFFANGGSQALIVRVVNEMDTALDAADFIGNESLKTGIYALDKADLFNLLCMSLDFHDESKYAAVVGAAARYCERRRAILLVDPPVGWTKNDVVTKIGDLGTSSVNAALYFPRLRKQNPTRGGQIEDFAACGAVAGVIARTDSTQGVWKSPAGTHANIEGSPDLAIELTSTESEELNHLGINCIRDFPSLGPVVWGARTLAGIDGIASNWNYLPVRRFALFLEESIYRGTQWVVFEPNDESLWAKIRLQVGAFLHDLFLRGAFHGRTAIESYFVKCDSGTTTQSDIDGGIVNVLVGFAPLKPAEFVVIKIQQFRA